MLVIGVPGLAKTMMVKALAELLGWDFRRIQFTPDLMPADITGTEILQSDESGPAARPGVPSRPGLRQPDPGRRDQPHAAQDAGGAAGSDAGAGGHRQRQDLSPGAAVHRGGHAEPDRAGRHLPAAGGAARPVHAQHPCGLPRRGPTKSAHRRPPDPRQIRHALARGASGGFLASSSKSSTRCRFRGTCWNRPWRSLAASRPKDPSADDYIRKYVAWGAGPARHAAPGHRRQSLRLAGWPAHA